MEVVDDSPKAAFRAALEEAIKEATFTSGDSSDTKHTFDNGHFIRSFRRIWAYTDNKPTPDPIGRSFGTFTIVFLKNESVTDIAYAELLSLLRANTYLPNTDEKGHISFFTSVEYSNFCINLWESLFGDQAIFAKLDQLQDRLQSASTTIVDNYWMLFSTAVIVDKLFSTCSVSIPRSLRTNLEQVVYHSGYIQSAGSSIYIRNLEKAKQTDLETRVGDFLSLSKNDGRKFYLTPYAEEYFTEHEKKLSALSVRNGLDGIRVNLRKHYIGSGDGGGSISLVDSLDRLRIIYKNNLFIPLGLLDYKAERKEALEEHNCDARCSIFVIVDRNAVPLSDGTSAVGGTRSYLIVYAQYFLNENVLLLLKERKPAWYAPVTLPHTLSTAMVNLASDTYTHDSPIILDPFCGTGTTLIDYFMRSEKPARLVGFDHNPSVSDIVRDNLNFLSLGRKQVSALYNLVDALLEMLGDSSSSISNVDGLKRIVKKLRSGGADLAETDQENIERIFSHVLAMLVEDGDSLPTDRFEEIYEKGMDVATRDFLANEKYEHRILFYFIFRSFAFAHYYIRGASGPDKKFFPAIEKEFLKVKLELKDYLETTSRKSEQKLGRFLRLFGAYSLAGNFDPTEFDRVSKHLSNPSESEFERMLLNPAKISPGFTIVAVRDSLTLLRKFERSVDLIITDPPYNINTNEGTAELLPLVVDHFVRALKSGGELIMALPSFSKNGKRVSYMCTEEFVSRKIQHSAHIANRKVSVKSVAGPGDHARGIAPYYWNASSGVSRNIVHFVIE